MTEAWGRDPRALWRRSGASIVLAAPGSEDVVLLEGTAALTWSLLDEPLAESELVGTLSEHYGIAHEHVQLQLAPFLEQLHECGAVCRL